MRNSTDPALQRVMEPEGEHFERQVVQENGSGHNSFVFLPHFKSRVLYQTFILRSHGVIHSLTLSPT